MNCSVCQKPILAGQSITAWFDGKAMSYWHMACHKPPCFECGRLTRERDEARSREDQIVEVASKHADTIVDLRAEVEALRETLTSIANNTCCDKCQEAALVAQAALAAGRE